MTTAELKITSNYIQALASQPDATERISLFLSGLLAMQPKDKLNTPKKKKKCVSTLIHFTQKEISKMAKTFKKEFIGNGLAAHVLKRDLYKKAVYYIIRYRRNGYEIQVGATTLEEAKEKFLEATKAENIEKYRKKEKRAKKNTFLFVTQEWLEFKKDKLNARTHKNYESYCQRYLYPVLGDIDISVIKTIDINGIMTKVEGRVYEDLRVVLNSVFKYALASGVITHNPMLLIPFKKAERNNRRAMTEDEVKKMIERLNMDEYSDYKRTFLILLFFGLRPCELEDARFEGNFLIARNAKRKNGKIEYKKIPICRQAREMLDLNAPVEALHRTDVLNRIFKRIMEDEEVTQYFLRHTFATVCQQYVRPDIVDIWMGDSSERLVGRVYTHFPDKFMIEQMQNVVFDI
mgnify:FL=1